MTRLHRSVFLLAAEPSGDKLGADLALQIKTNKPDIELQGIGGAFMAAAGVQSDFDITPLAIMGFTEALKVYPVVRKKVKEATAMILENNPDAVVLIDSWGFMIRVAEALKKAGYQGKIIKYVAPHVWAMRPGRAKVLARSADHLLSIHSMDAPFFEEAGIPVTFVGNPMFDDDFATGDEAGFRRRHQSGEKLTLALLFGSRPTEIERLYEPFMETIAALKEIHADLQVFGLLSTAIESEIRDRAKQDPRMKQVTLLPETEKYDLFVASDMALACSGTVTTQLAVFGVPSVVAYILSPLTFAIAKRLYQPEHISLVNISADEALMPEFMQKDVNSETLLAALKKYLDDPKLRASVSKRLMKQTQIMQGKGGTASKQAASAIINILDAA